MLSKNSFSLPLKTLPVSFLCELKEEPLFGRQHILSPFPAKAVGQEAKVKIENGQGHVADGNCDTFRQVPFTLTGSCLILNFESRQLAWGINGGGSRFGISQSFGAATIFFLATFWVWNLQFRLWFLSYFLTLPVARLLFIFFPSVRDLFSTWTQQLKHKDKRFQIKWFSRASNLLQFKNFNCSTLEAPGPESKALKVLFTFCQRRTEIEWGQKLRVKQREEV